MKRYLFAIALLLSSSSYLVSNPTPPVTCPCVGKNDGKCCCGCTAAGKECRCAEEYAKQGTVPATCSCPKTTPEVKQDERTRKPYSHASSAHIAVSYGELFDKITILEIKSEQITDTQKLEHICFELDNLNKSLNIILAKSEDCDLLRILKEQLKEINWQLWQVEDAIRVKEHEKAFDEEFIDLARKIYNFNDARATVKRKISELLHSRIVEEKSYAVRQQ
jgi:hypothetical protein